MLSSPGLVAAEESFQLMRAGRVHLDDVVPSSDGEREVELYFRAETLIGEPLRGLRQGSVSIRDNGEVVEPAAVRLQLLSEAGVGTAAVLVLDTSRTMQGEPFEQAKAAALEFMGRMGEFDHVALVSFDDSVQVEAGFGAPRTQVRQALQELQVQPKTLSKLVWDGASKAVELLKSRPPSMPRRGFVILFSDGRDSGSISSLEEVIELAQGAAGQGRTPVFTIGYSRFGGAGLEGLDELAHSSGASSFQVDSPSETRRFFDEIWKRMTQSFVVRYPGQMDGAEHTVAITIEDRSDSRQVVYPEIKPPLWPWLAGALALLGTAVGTFVLMRGRSAGRLIFEGGPRSGQVVAIKGSKLRVGALEENDLVINFPTISRYHAQLHAKGGRIEVEDLGSKNGTFINGTPLRARSQLSPGDRLRFGDVEMVYRK